MTFLAAPDRREIQKQFEELRHDVDISYFTDAGCATCSDTKVLLEELVSLSDKIHLNVHDLVNDQGLARQHGIYRAPALVISSRFTQGRPRFFGMPTGHEFATLLGTIIAASSGQTQLDAALRETVAAIDKPVHIQVFVTPTCPYCGPVARLAHQVALENAHVTADVIEINEFEDLARRYVIRGVPKTVINDDVEFMGSVSEEQFLEYLKRAI